MEAAAEIETGFTNLFKTLIVADFLADFSNHWPKIISLSM